jgi:hypothetical protein
MMKKLLNGLLALCFSLAFMAQAITIDLIPDQSQLHTGDTLVVEVRISGLEDNNAPSLGAYDVTFNYDDRLFSFNQIIRGDSILGNQMDLMGFGTLQDANHGNGWINLFELSFDGALDLDTLQAGGFTLFSVLLDAIGTGTGDFSLEENTLSDAYGNDLFTSAINSASATVGSTSVPEPSAFLLLLGMLAMIGLRSGVMQHS